jgi:hypothetical protein
LEAMFCFKSELTKQTTCYSAFECQLSWMDPNCHFLVFVECLIEES